MAAGRVRAAIGRASDFFGAGATESTLGQRVFGNAVAGKRVDFIGRPDLPHTYSYVPDIAAGLATLGTDERAAGQVWHLRLESAGMVTRTKPAVTAAVRAGRAGYTLQEGAVEGFLLAYEGFDPEAEGLREALTSTGNGYLCARGAAEWEDADGVHYPGTYVHGGYNRETTILGGLPVLNEDLVNLPNWLVLQVRIEGGDAIRLADVELLAYRHELDIRFATVIRHLVFRDQEGRETALHSRRFVSMADAHHGGIEWTLVPGNWSGRVEMVTAIDGRVSNAGVARYQQLEARHLNPVGPRTLGSEVIALKAETRQSNLYVSHAARTRVFRADQPVQVERRLYQMEDYIQQVLAFDVRQGEADAGREAGDVLHVAGPGGQRHAGEGGHVGGPAHRFRRLVRAARRGVGGAVAGV